MACEHCHHESDHKISCPWVKAVRRQYFWDLPLQVIEECDTLDDDEEAVIRRSVLEDDCD